MIEFSTNDDPMSGTMGEPPIQKWVPTYPNYETNAKRPHLHFKLPPLIPPTNSFYAFSYIYCSRLPANSSQQLASTPHHFCSSMIFVFLHSGFFNTWVNSLFEKVNRPKSADREKSFVHMIMGNFLLHT